MSSSLRGDKVAIGLADSGVRVWDLAAMYDASSSTVSSERTKQILDIENGKSMRLTGHIFPGETLLPL